MNEHLSKWFYLRIRTAKDGVMFTVKADPRVESFFKSLGSGTADPIEIYGRGWVGADLKVYNLATELEEGLRDEVTITHIAGSMVQNGMVNLGFLRLQGITEGLSFVVTQPMSLAKLKSLKRDILDGVRLMLQEYVVPVDITLELISRENLNAQEEA